MFARLSTYEIPEDRVPEATRSFADALEQIASCRGLCEAYFLVSGDSDRGVALTLWDDHDSMSAARVLASRLRSEAVRTVDGAVVSVDEFEVAVHIRGDR